MSLRALAQQAGISRSNLSSIERGASSPTIRTGEEIASVLGVSLAELLESKESELTMRKRLVPCKDRQDRGCNHVAAGRRRSSSCGDHLGLIAKKQRW